MSCLHYYERFKAVKLHRLFLYVLYRLGKAVKRFFVHPELSRIRSALVNNGNRLKPYYSRAARCKSVISALCKLAERTRFLNAVTALHRLYHHSVCNTLALYIDRLLENIYILGKRKLYSKPFTLVFYIVQALIIKFFMFHNKTIPLCFIYPSLR